MYKVGDTVELSWDSGDHAYHCPKCFAIQDKFHWRDAKGKPVFRKAGRYAYAHISFHCGFSVVSPYIIGLSNRQDVKITTICSPTAFEMDEIDFRKYVKKLLESVCY